MRRQRGAFPTLSALLLFFSLSLSLSVGVRCPRAGKLTGMHFAPNPPSPPHPWPNLYNAINLSPSLPPLSTDTRKLGNATEGGRGVVEITFFGRDGEGEKNPRCCCCCQRHTRNTMCRSIKKWSLKLTKSVFLKTLSDFKIYWKGERQASFLGHPVQHSIVASDYIWMVGLPLTAEASRPQRRDGEETFL